MKRFLNKLLFFMLPLLVLAYPLDALISTNLKKSNNFFGSEFPVWNAIFSGEMNSKIFIYGSSRAWIHINPKIIADSLKTSAYNFGVNGHNFKLQKLRHELLLKHDTKPQTIIHSLDIFTLQAQEELFNKEQFLPYMLFNGDLKKPLLEYDGFRGADFDLPLVRYYGGYPVIREAWVQMTGIDKNAAIRVNGFKAEDQEWDGNFDRIKENKRSVTATLDNALISDFETYLKNCRINGIQVVLVYTPEYYEFQKMVSNRADVIARYRKIAEQNNIVFLDYSAHPITLSKKYFYNATHMNMRGAEIFNRQLVADLKSIKNHSN